MGENERKRNRETKEYREDDRVRKNRRFPKSSLVGLIALMVLQAALLMLAIFYNPKPKDLIRNYSIRVVPQSDGTLVMDYSITWVPLDQNEPLTWVEIGMANGDFFFDRSATSSNISDVYADVNADEEYAYAHIILDRPYRANEELTFSFRVRQGSMLCKSGDGFSYEFIPGWFNEIRVERYEFRWEASNGAETSTGVRDGDDYVWTGSLNYGEQVRMRLQYPSGAFPADRAGNDTTHYAEGSNELLTSKIMVCVFAGVAILLIGIGEAWLIDSVVSYHRGRGFICRYGYHVHVYGRSNPHYRRAAEKHAASSGGKGGFGGGCACACACACAGGGRAGCSQKDVMQIPE